MTHTRKELAELGVAPEVLETRHWRRHTAHLTQDELGQLLGLSRTYIERIELGLVPMPRAWPALCAELRARWHESLRPARSRPDGRGGARTGAKKKAETSSEARG